MITSCMGHHTSLYEAKAVAMNEEPADMSDITACGCGKTCQNLAAYAQARIGKRRLF